MTTWEADDLAAIGDSEELTIASLRPDGTLRRPIPIWVVQVGDDIIVRSVFGRTAGWFRNAMSAGVGRISAGGIDREAAFEDYVPDEVIREQIDSAFLTKYARFDASIVDPTVTPVAASATVRILPV